MKTKEFDLHNRFDSEVMGVGTSRREVDLEMGQTDEELLACISSTPVGKLLRMISTLPEIRQEKVCSARLQIANGDYELEPVLDEALDRVLEEFIAEI